MKARNTVPFLLLFVIPTAFFPPVQHAASDLRLAVHEALDPLWASAQFLTSNAQGGLRRLSDIVHLYQNYELLQDEVQKLRHEVEILRRLEKENERLNELLEIKKKYPKQSISGRIITRNISHWFRWVVIDAGKEDGVKEHMVLLNEQGVVGRVIEVGRSVSQCMLLTDPESRISVVTQSTRAAGIASGDGSNERLRMSLIPLDAKIEIGDMVITSGLGGVYPRGLLVGKIMSIAQDRDGMHLSAYVDPAVDFNMLEDVLCIDYSRQDLLQR
ncbi:MAG: rod shape-determining protein MreC [Candidatus Omnitrophica bacterium]|nr:rod shape-determining protein MreC [Candidatus Omnitrophota bacterium]